MGPGLAEAKVSDRKAGNDDDLALVDRVIGADAQAFEQLVRRHERRVFRVTLAVTGNLEDAEEAMQDAFFKAYRRIRDFRRESKFTTWLTRIAVNEGLQRLRSRKEMKSLDDPAFNGELQMPQRVEEWQADPEKQYAKQEIREIVEQAIQSLPPVYRVTFVLRDLEGLSTEEAAEVIGLSVPALKSRLLRARLMVRETLAQRFEKRPGLKARFLRAGMRIRQAVAARVGRPPGLGGGM